jgi:hypothetical protein
MKTGKITVKNVLLLTEPVSFYNFQIKSSLYSQGSRWQEPMSKLAPE